MDFYNKGFFMTNKQEDKIIKFTQDYYSYCLCRNNKFCLERYTDYDDKFPEDIIEEILSGEHPESLYYETIDDWDINCSDWSYQDDFWSELEDFCEKENKDVDENSEEYIGFDEAQDFVIDNFTWKYPEELLNPDFTVRIELTSDCGGDFIIDNIDKDEDDEGLDPDYYDCPLFYVTLSLKDAISILEKEVKTITLKKGTYCEYSIWEDNDYYGGHYYDADGELNKDITINCKDIYAIHYESMDTDYEEIVLGERIKESNRKRFSKKLKESLKENEIYQVTSANIFVEPIGQRTEFPNIVGEYDSLDDIIEKACKEEKKLRDSDWFYFDTYPNKQAITASITDKRKIIAYVIYIDKVINPASSKITKEEFNKAGIKSTKERDKK